ncbi:MAG: hypothetical protein ACJAYB_000060 [Psychromonas sp.]|jgi:hypothetical protein
MSISSKETDELRKYQRIIEQARPAKGNSPGNYPDSHKLFEQIQAVHNKYHPEANMVKLINKCNFSYSWDNYRFDNGLFDSVESALADARTNADDQQTVFICQVITVENHKFFPNAHVILEDMQCQAEDIGGDCAEDYLDVSIEAEDELTNGLHNLIATWCKTHGVTPDFGEIGTIHSYDLVSGEIVADDEHQDNASPV